MDKEDSKYDTRIVDALILEDIDDQNPPSPSKIIPKQYEFPETNFTNAALSQSPRDPAKMKILEKKDEMNSPVSLKISPKQTQPVMLEESVKEDTNFSLEAQFQNQIMEESLPQDFGSKSHNDSDQ